VLEGGQGYSDQSICANNGDDAGNAKLPQCAYRLIGSTRNGLGITYDGIPLQCSATTAVCAVAAPTATCFTTAPCKTNTLVVNGTPFYFAPPGFAYNMGRYPIKYKSADSSDTCRFLNGTASPSCTRDVIFQDTQPPIITITGGSMYIVEGGNTFTDPGATAHDVVDGVMQYIADPPCTIENGKFLGFRGKICRFANIVGFMLNTTLVGNQTIFYVATDTSGNLRDVSRTIVVIDTTPPIITVQGPSPIVHEAARQYIDRRATAVDIVDGNVTSTIKLDNPVNTFPNLLPINYTVTYTVNDKAGNKAITKTRTVILKDTTPAFISIIGDNLILVEGATLYTEQFAYAIDAFDGDITNKINYAVARLSNRDCMKSTGCDNNDIVDVFAPAGTSYLLTYSVFDKAFNFNSTSRYVKIIDTTPPSVHLIGPAVLGQEGQNKLMF
jgi:hypothetical protein